MANYTKREKRKARIAERIANERRPRELDPRLRMRRARHVVAQRVEGDHVLLHGVRAGGVAIRQGLSSARLASRSWHRKLWDLRLVLYLVLLGPKARK